MSAVPGARRPDLAAEAQLPHRPAGPPSALFDGVIAVAVYLVAYWLRFSGGRLETFLPGLMESLPLVVAGQLAALAAMGAYARRPRIDWLLRVVGGVIGGTVAAVVVLGVASGFKGVSRSAFFADAVLLSVAALGWRGAWVLRARARTRASAPAADDELIDRASDVATIGSVVASLYGHRELLRNLVFKDLKLKYRGSVFGFLWSLANPLLMIVVYTLAFTFIMRMRGEGFVFYLMLGMLSWTFFAGSASMSTGAIVDNGALLKSVPFPRAILPISTVLFNLAQYLLTISLFLPVMMLWYRIPLAAPMLLFPIFLALQVTFTIGVALILATWTAFFRDVRHLLEVTLAMLFWTTPIVFELRDVPEQFKLLILLSPVSPFIVAYHEMFYYRQWPDLAVWLVATMHAGGAFVIGSLLFLAFEDRFTEQL